jgi:molybdenum cofactor cytidylyltransferase
MISSDNDIATSVLILAAGNSERMGVSKLFLKLPNGITFIEHLVNEYQKFGCKQIAIVVNQSNEAEIINSHSHLLNRIEIAINPNPGLGRFRSVKFGLKAIVNPSNVFIHNIDNPYCDTSILNVLQENIVGFDYVVPTFKGKGGHPILISYEVVSKIRKKAKNDCLLNEFLSRFNGNRIEVNSDTILKNINTPDEYNSFLLAFELKH